MPPRKRERSPSEPFAGTSHLSTTPAVADSPFYLQAVEASLVRGHHGLANQVVTRSTEGGRMVQWAGLPADQSSPISDSGFTDLPSDSEDMFYFTVEERDEINAARKRRRLEDDRMERLKAREEEDRLREEERRKKEEEENTPTETQLAMMFKLHSTLRSADNPALLEIRILANHGSDAKFGFMRKGGKFNSIWEDIRSGKRKEAAATPPSPPPDQSPAQNGGLVGYESDSQDEAEEKAKEESPREEPSRDAGDDEAAAKLREEKARKVAQWAKKRKEAREAV
ncbi:hypothetical protein MNV49_004834 [Pseudohyphozyma bogoriensis]|nr:hypothetical protein MNV49_004834 [Pseudohyphozyma bogoriensis]